MTRAQPPKSRIRQRSESNVYQISWDEKGNLQTSPLQQSLPAQQLSFQEINTTLSEELPVWSYTFSLAGLLLCWVLYLLLPRGFRKQYCNASRKRYVKQKEGDMPPAGYWFPASRSLASSVVSSAVGNKRAIPAASTFSSVSQTPPRTGSLFAAPDSGGPFRDAPKHPPSPDHPALKKIPPNKIIAETMGRLQGRGIRLVAHGVHCDPKRVWIKLDEEDPASVTWQTEFPRRVPNSGGQVSIVLMRGSLHRIHLINILYIDVGKKTNAFQRLGNIPDGTCFSLLTQNGSLDLQANSKLERDALVSCFCMVLDDVHGPNGDWRNLYEVSPDPSLVSSAGPNTANRQESDLMVQV